MTDARRSRLGGPVGEGVWAVAAGVVSVLAAALALRLTPSLLTARWSTGSDDGTLHYILFTSATQAFPYIDNPALGFPHGLNVFFTGQIDVASAVVIGLLALVIHSGTTLLDVFDLLAFFGIGVTATLFFRALRVSRPLAALFGVLFAVAPYHFIRIGYGHAFIANYWAVPLAGILALVVNGRETDPFAGWAAAATTSRGRRVRRILPPLVLTLLVALTGAYYFVFALIVVGGVWLVAAFRVLLRRDGARSLVVPTVTTGALGLLVGSELVVLGLGFGQRYAPYFASRSPVESEMYAGRLTSLLAPWTGTGIPVVGRLVAEYQRSSPVLKLTESPGTPLVASVGLILLMLALVAAVVGGTALERTWFGRVALDPRTRLLGLASVWAALFYVVTGLGIVVAVAVGPEIRAWSRFSIFLALFGLGFVAILVDRATSRRLVRPALVAVIVVVAVVDQLAGVHRAVPLTPVVDEQAASFVAAAEKALPAGCGVVQLPLKSFPDSGRIAGLGDYDEGRLYLATTDARLRWSYGSVTGTRGWDLWKNAGTPGAFASAVHRSKACAVEVDQVGFIGHPDAWRPYVSAATGGTTPAVTSDHRRYLLFTVPGS
ncbi:hypothetical protein [Frondihabitans australicus]|uniref:4-amino-4-deoxy-L-arabinose transferase-like glycosyltransferase n=1 Tax=Frondihabitans australicus TaxID=386892 RepID=A0A495IDQ0_9MICO|nr:hypothetical protein [Frondihabitans australicus]RKR73255.1 hypothetical protein C8E83_0345 [Frondihabitans australicus]